MVSGGAPAIKSDLATGTPAPSRARAAGQFWTFTMSNSGRKASTFAETMNLGVELPMQVFLTRIASGDARHRRQRAFRLSGHRLAAPKSAKPTWALYDRRSRVNPRSVNARHSSPDARIRSRTTRVRLGENLCLENYFGPSGPSCLSAEGLARRRLVRLSRTLFGLLLLRLETAIGRTHDAPSARPAIRSGAGGAERDGMCA